MRSKESKASPMIALLVGYKYTKKTYRYNKIHYICLSLQLKT